MLQSKRVPLPSSFHLRWARVLMKEGYDQDRWQEELDLTLSYDPESINARRLRLIGRLPAFIRPDLISFWTLVARLKSGLRSRLVSISIPKRLKQVFLSYGARVFGKLFYYIIHLFYAFSLYFIVKQSLMISIGPFSFLRVYPVVVYTMHNLLTINL